MCGIYGSTKLYTESQIFQKLNRVKFRGPDHVGYKILDEKIIFGHNRLAIIDLDSRSNQPFNYQNITIVFNGEIYNFKELQTELIKYGYEFRTSSDTEVICASYFHWGNDCVKKFNGMFSFVIYDKKNNILFGSRDRLGKKPFYYINNGSWFEFASQPSQLLIGNNFTLNERSVSQFLVWHNVPEPFSIFNEVKKLPAGCSFTFDLATSNFKIFNYWDLELNNIIYSNYNEAKSDLRELLLDATKIRMFADVPIGVFLSGGIDSSLIASLAQSLSTNQINTFSIKFNEADFDESIYASDIANYLKTNHTTITCNYNDGLSLIEDITYYFDEPFGDGSAIPTMLLAKHTKNDVTVALSGDGGDEGFLGYERYDWMLKFEKMMNMPSLFRFPMSEVLKLCDNKRLQSIGHVINQKSLSEIYKSINSTTNKDFLLNQQLALTITFNDFLETDNLNILERISNYDIKTYLNDDINTKVDRATMAYSLESRAPLMDYRVIEFSRKIPSYFKYDRGNKKRILKDLLSDFLPVHLFDRPKKGFGAPLNNWFRNELKPYVLDILSEENLREIPNINVDKVKYLINMHMKNKLDSNVLIWDLLILIQWKKRFNL
jgi:asparagine synthase (glutamine-hydrolysing)